MTSGKDELSCGIEEIDALIAASERARKAVGERRTRLMEAHALTRKEDERSLITAKRCDVEADHDEARAKTPGRAQSAPPADAVIPPAPAYASKSEASEWEEYHRFCARGALFSAMDEGRLAERELSERVADLEARRSGDDGMDEDGLAEAIRESKGELERNRRRMWGDLRARFAAYDTRPPSLPGHEARLRELRIPYPSPADVVARAEAEWTNRAARHQDRSTSVVVVVAEPPEPAMKKPSKRMTRKKKKKHAEAFIAAEFASVAENDPTIALPMYRLPANPHGLVDPEGNPQPLSECVQEHVHPLDLSFPGLDSYRRAEHDVATYFMDDYTAHLSEPHAGDGGFWSSSRAKVRALKAQRKPLAAAASAKKQRRREAPPSATEKLRVLLLEGARVLSQKHQDDDDDDDDDALERGMAEALAAALDHPGNLEELLLSDERRGVVAAGLAELLGHAGVLSRRPTAYECERYAVACARSTDGLTFHQLAKFVSTALTLEANSIAEAVASAVAAADRADKLLESGDKFEMPPEDDDDDDDDDNMVSRLAAYLNRSQEFIDETMDPKSAWAVVETAAAAAQEATHVFFPVADEADPDEGAAATISRFFSSTTKTTVPRDQLVGFVRFAIWRAALCARRDQRRCAAAVEAAYSRLRDAPPSSDDDLRETVEKMIDDGTIPASAARAIVSADDARDAAIQSLMKTNEITCPMVDAFKPAFDNVYRVESSEHFRLYASYFFSSSNNYSWRSLGTFFMYAATMALLELHRAGRLIEIDIPERRVDEATGQPSSEILLVRALHCAVIAAAATSKGPDFDKAFAALAGERQATLEPAEAAALLRPFATHWGGQAGALLAGRSQDNATQVAFLLASPSGLVDAKSLDQFVQGTTALDAVPKVLAQRVVVVPPDQVAKLEIHESTAPDIFNITAALFPGCGDDVKATIEVTALRAEIPSPFLPLSLLQSATYDPAEARLAHPSALPL